jgi:hypothetical protein
LFQKRHEYFKSEFFIPVFSNIPPKIDNKADLDGSPRKIRTLISMKGKIFKTCLKNVDYKPICELLLISDSDFKNNGS